MRHIVWQFHCHTLSDWVSIRVDYLEAYRPQTLTKPDALPAMYRTSFEVVVDISVIGDLTRRKRLWVNYLIA